jgi:hypothetical protein
VFSTWKFFVLCFRLLQWRQLELENDPDTCSHRNGVPLRSTHQLPPIKLHLAIAHVGDLLPPPELSESSWISKSWRFSVRLGMDRGRSYRSWLFQFQNGGAEVLRGIGSSSTASEFDHHRDADVASMVWDDNLSEFALSRVVEVMKSGVCCSHDFKERHMVTIANDVLNFTRKAVSTS